MGELLENTCMHGDSDETRDQPTTPVRPPATARVSSHERTAVLCLWLSGYLEKIYRCRMIAETWHCVA
jgi:hypothetical protein